MIYTFPRNAQQHGTEEKKFFSIVLFWRFFFFFVFVHPLHSSSSAPTTTTWLISFDSCQHCVASHSLLNLRMKCLRGCMLCTLRCCSRLRLCLCNSIEKSFEVFISPFIIVSVCVLVVYWKCGCSVHAHAANGRQWIEQTHRGERAERKGEFLRYHHATTIRRRNLLRGKNEIGTAKEGERAPSITIAVLWSQKKRFFVAHRSGRAAAIRN